MEFGEFMAALNKTAVHRMDVLHPILLNLSYFAKHILQEHAVVSECLEDPQRTVALIAAKEGFPFLPQCTMMCWSIT